MNRRSRSVLCAAGAALFLALTSMTPSFGEDISGDWTTKGYEVAGTWTIDADAGTVTLSDDFRTRKAPDLKIFLSPLAVGEVQDDNATEGSILVAELASAEGRQSYELPGEIDLSDYRSILIHCERFSKLWAAADLR